jgi:homoprotocatechuate degradation regulator HpaR
MNGKRHRAARAKTAASPAAQSSQSLRRFSHSLPMLLLRAREAVMRHFRASLREHGVTEQQWRVLRALDAARAVEISELARATFILAPSLSRIIRDLDRRDLVNRINDSLDLRRSLISIAPAGLELIERVAPRSEAIYGEIARRFGAQRLAELQRLLEDLEHCVAPTRIGRAEPDAPGEAPSDRRASGEKAFTVKS